MGETCDMKYFGYGIIKDHEGDVMITRRDFECDKGPHTIKEIIKLCDLKDIIQPHRIRVYKYRPDEDYTKLTKCDRWCAITTSDPCPITYEITWGDGNIIRAPFVPCREKNGKLYPFESDGIEAGCMRFMIRRSEWRRDRDDICENDKLRTDLCNVNDLIDYLGGSKNNR